MPLYAVLLSTGGDFANGEGISTRKGRSQRILVVRPLGLYVIPSRSEESQGG